MKAAFFQIFFWMLAGGSSGTMIWYFKQEKEVVDLPDISLRLFERSLQAKKTDKFANLERYKSIEQLSWVPIKPPPPPPPPKQKEAPKSPFLLTRVINSRMVELMNIQDKQKRTYRVGDAITVRDKEKRRRKKVGKVLELNRENQDEDRLTIDYLGNTFILVLDDKKSPLYQRMNRAINRRKLNNKNLNGLDEHEGRKLGANHYELNYEFFNAVIDNAQTEGMKLDFVLGSDNNFRITRLTNNSVLRKFGFKEQDVLLAFNGKRVKSTEDLVSIYKDFLISRVPTATIRVRRSGKAVDVKFNILTNTGKYKEFYE
jgi:hypothetical protein